MKNLKTYLLYHLKWQTGIVISWPCMYVMHDVWGWNNFWTIIGFQFVGALIFWNIDKLIFKHDKKTNTHTNESDTQINNYKS
jgi:hypothetical protein